MGRRGAEHIRLVVQRLNDLATSSVVPVHLNENSFSYERMSTKTRFEKEAKGNSEMA